MALQSETFPSPANLNGEAVVQKRQRLEERILEHIAQAPRLGEESLSHNDSIRRKIVTAIGGHSDIEIMRAAGEEFGEPFSHLLTFFAPFWIRRPAAWSGGERESLIDHLFVAYEVPRFLYRQWRCERYPMDLKWIAWFLLFAQGGSLRRAGSIAGQWNEWFAPPRFARFLLSAPADLDPDSACMFAEVTRMGGSPTEFQRLHRKIPYRVNPTMFPPDSERMLLWRGALRWLISHRHQLNDENSSLILGWALHEHAETGNSSPLRRLGARSALRRAEAYDRELELRFPPPQRLPPHREPVRMPEELTWDGHGWDRTVPSTKGEWTFVELTSSSDLRKEGAQMHHCVQHYARRCADGECAIISARLDGVARLTLEIDPKTRRLVQARGHDNRWPTSTEQDAVNRWRSTLRPSPQQAISDRSEVAERSHADLVDEPD